MFAYTHTSILSVQTNKQTSTQAAGFYQEYGKNLVFATVRNAGHMVPESQPARAYAMLERFLHSGHIRDPLAEEKESKGHDL